MTGKVLVTGGVRSGKSRHAEGLLETVDTVTYVAAGPRYDDADWADRIAVHQQRRPSTWATVETHDIAGAIRNAVGPVLVDCLGTWLTAVIDEAELWEESQRDIAAHVLARLDDLVAALRETSQPVVLVTNEVGLGVVPEHRSGRIFRDLLGTINQRVAEACDDVHLVIAGRVLHL